MLFALHHGDRVERLIVADIAPRTYVGNQDAVIASLNGVDLSCVSSRDDADRLLSDTIDSASLRAFLLTNLVRRDGQYAWRINLPSIVASLLSIYAFPEAPGLSYDGPALFVAGAESNYVRAGDEAPIRSLFPDARFTRIAGAGHWLHADHPAEFQAIVKRFLSEQGTS